MIGRLVAGYPLAKFEVEIKAKDGRRVMLEVNPRVILKDGKAAEIQGIARDITGRDAAEIELRQAQKLESVGRLATGIAHEINTPMQFVGDNVRFLQDSFKQLQALLDKLRGLCDPSAGFVLPPAFCAEFSRLETEMDSAYIMKETPDAIVQTLDGIERVVTIVRAMKEFAHPEDKGMAHADINRALLNTLTVARNELKYVAEVVTDFGDLPLVVCSLGDMNQVFLNLLVNAAHAMGMWCREQAGRAPSASRPEWKATWRSLLSPTRAPEFQKRFATGSSTPFLPPKKWGEAPVRDSPSHAP